MLSVDCTLERSRLFEARSKILEYICKLYCLLPLLEAPQTAVDNYGAMSDWDTSHVRSMTGLFKDLTSFNEDISRWNTSMVIGRGSNM